MKNIFLALITASLTFFYACSNSGKSVVERSSHVYGNCEKCKERIEKAAKIDGVKEVNWDVNSKMLTVKLDSNTTSVNSILRAISAAGHDNDAFMGDDYAYDKLPECCQYERKTEQ